MRDQRPDATGRRRRSRRSWPFMILSAPAKNWGAGRSAGGSDRAAGGPRTRSTARARAGALDEHFVRFLREEEPGAILIAEEGRRVLAFAHLLCEPPARADPSRPADSRDWLISGTPPPSSFCLRVSRATTGDSWPVACPVIVQRCASSSGIVAHLDRDGPHRRSVSTLLASHVGARARDQWEARTCNERSRGCS